MKGIIILSLMLLSIGIVTAQEECIICKDTYNGLFNQQLTQEQFTQEVAKIQLPKGVQTALGKEVIVNLYLEEKSIGIKIKEGKVETLQETSFEYPKISIWTSTATIKKIIESSNKKKALQEALEKEEIKYQGHTFATRIKIKLAKKMLFKEETFTGRMIQRIEHLKEIR